jgi:hypothetical protein
VYAGRGDPPIVPTAHDLNLVTESVYIDRDNIFLPRVGVEVAVGAAVPAERNVEIEGAKHTEEGLVGGVEAN